MAGVTGVTVQAIHTNPVLEGATIHPALMVVVTAVETVEKRATVMNAPTTMEGVNKFAPILLGPTPAHAIEITNLLRIGRNVPVSLLGVNCILDVYCDVWHDV